MQNAVNHLKPQVAAALDASFEVATLALSQVERATHLALEQSKHNVEFARAQLNAVNGLKDPAEVFQFVQGQLEASAKYAAGLAAEAFELSQEFQAELSELAESHFDANHGEANKLIAQALKNAPQGSEAAVAAVKQAVEAGNKAVTEARKVAKQAAKLAQDSVEQVKSKVSSAKPATRRRR